ncbi:kyphoscoliosis peptidase [Pelomyxa schiedti]|nr:kyphoscoliosis peptidase [Pelomyxa schiedti]
MQPTPTTTTAQKPRGPPPPPPSHSLKPAAPKPRSLTPPPSRSLPPPPPPAAAVAPPPPSRGALPPPPPPSLPSSASTSASTSTSAGTPAAAPPAILVTLPGLSSPPPPTPPSAAATSSAAALAPPASRPRSKSDEGKHHVGGWKERAMETCSKLKSGVKDITHSVKEDLQVVLDGEPRERQMPDGTRVIVYPLLPALLFGTPTVPGSLNLNEDYEGYDDRHHKPSTEWQSVTPGPPPPPNVQFLALDSATRALPNVSTIPELVNALQSTITHSTTSAAAASDQWQLLRAIYVWVAENITYDVDAYRTGTRLPCDPQSVFSMRKGVCQGISNLTVKLCVLCGIHARVVLGWGKGAGYQEGQQLGQPNHAWVLARIPGSGDYLLDVAWAAGACDATLTRFIKQFSACWFGTDPSLFALTHLPHPPHTRFALLPNAELPSCTTFESAKFYPTGFIQRLVDSGFPQRSLATLATSRGASTGVAKLPDPSNLDRIVRLGFSPDEIVNISLAGGDLVHAYDTDPGVSISVLQAPLTHIIKRGTSHIIRIKSNTEMGVAFEIGGKWTHLAKKGTTFEAELQATKDGKVGLLCSKDLRNFQCILEWVVV